MASIYRYLVEHGIQIQCDTQVDTFQPVREGMKCS